MQQRKMREQWMVKDEQKEEGVTKKKRNSFSPKATTRSCSFRSQPLLPTSPVVNATAATVSAVRPTASNSVSPRVEDFEGEKSQERELGYLLYMRKRSARFCRDLPRVFYRYLLLRRRQQYPRTRKVADIRFIRTLEVIEGIGLMLMLLSEQLFIEAALQGTSA